MARSNQTVDLFATRVAFVAAEFGVLVGRSVSGQHFKYQNEKG